MGLNEEFNSENCEKIAFRVFQKTFKQKPNGPSVGDPQPVTPLNLLIAPRRSIRIISYLKDAKRISLIDRLLN